MHIDSKEYCHACDVCQRTGRPSHRDEIPLESQETMEAFYKWAIDFVGPINPPGKNTGVRYIITTTDNLNRWEESQLVKDCREEKAAHFIFENILTRFGCHKILMSDQGTHFLNGAIQALTIKFKMHNQKSTPYHP